jgi:hypothetical protein
LSCSDTKLQSETASVSNRDRHHPELILAKAGLSQKSKASPPTIQSKSKLDACLILQVCSTQESTGKLTQKSGGKSGTRHAAFSPGTGITRRSWFSILYDHGKSR